MQARASSGNPRVRLTSRRGIGCPPLVSVPWPGYDVRDSPPSTRGAMPAIRHHVHIASTPRKVWAALTTAEGLMNWWVDEARVDSRKGGRVVIEFEDDEDPSRRVG